MGEKVKSILRGRVCGGVLVGSGDSQGKIGKIARRTCFRVLSC